MKLISVLSAVLFLAVLQFPACAQEPAAPMPPTAADGAKLQVAFEEKGRFFEGPVWDTKTNKLFFTAHAGNNKPFQILRLDAPTTATVWMNETQGINGMTPSRDGRLLGAQGGAKPPAIVSIGIGAAGPADVKVLCAASDALPMTQTNDLSQDAKGGVYFTAPDFGQKTRSAVFYCAPDGKLSRVVANLKLPNGLEVSNDGKTLYVSDSFEKRVYSYPIKDDASLDLAAVRIFFDPDTPNQSDPDGMTTDADGNLYFAMRGGIWVVSQQGKMLGLIPIPEFVSNVAFGGTDGHTLYMTCSDRVYSLAMKSHGTRWK